VVTSTRFKDRAWQRCGGATPSRQACSRRPLAYSRIAAGDSPEGCERLAPALASRMNGGALCISIDLELAWGIWEKPSAEYHRLCAEKERFVNHALLELFAAREIPATYAIVGRLLARPERFPTATEFGDRIWYAPDLVEAIRSASPAHDIGSHGFAHRYFPGTRREQLREDLQAARHVHETYGLPFTSFVFPRNEVAHLDLLAEAGLEVFRALEAGWHMSVRRRIGRLPGRAANLADKLLPIAPSVVEPTLQPSGLVALPGSMLFVGRNGLRRLVHPELIERKARLGLRRAAREGRIFHLWFHPANFYYDTDVQLGMLEKILDEACAMRDRAELEIRTMASYARRDAGRRGEPVEAGVPALPAFDVRAAAPPVMQPIG
jgi:peptidoglycan/xylan/chitin deacetylase (PgdA/CDA1 family)